MKTCKECDNLTMAGLMGYQHCCKVLTRINPVTGEKEYAGCIGIRAELGGKECPNWRKKVSTWEKIKREWRGDGVT